MFGPEFGKTGRSVGEGLPRSLIEGLTVGAAMAAPEVSIPLGVLAGAGTLSAGAKAYTETGSPVAGLIHGGVNLLFPTAGRLGSRFITGQLSKRIGENVATEVGIKSSAPVSEKMVDFAGEVLGTTALMELANQGTKLATHQPLGVSAQDLFGDLLGNAAFAPFQLFHAFKGPGKGEWDSVGHMLRASDEARTQIEAQRKSQSNFVNTEEAKVPIPQEPLTFPSMLDALARSRAEDRSGTLFGKPIESLGSTKRPSRSSEVQLLNTDSNIISGREIRWEDPIQQVLYGERRKGKELKLPQQAEEAVQKQIEALGPPPLTPEQHEQLIAKASAIVEQGVVGTGAEGVRVASETANELTQHTGGTHVTDQALAEQMADHMTVRSPEEALRMVQQSVDNKVNQEAAELRSKQPSIPEAPTKLADQTGQDANARLASLPDPVKDFLGDGIVEAQKRASKTHSSISDLAADAHTKAALGWLEKNPISPEKMTPAERNAKLNDLTRTLNAATNKKALEVASSDKKKGIQHGTEKPAVTEPNPVELPEPRKPDGLDTFATEAHDAEARDYHNRATEAISGLLAEGDVKPEELKAAGLTADEAVGRRVMAVLKDIALGANFGEAGSRSKKGFRFVPSDETRKIFGAKDSTIQDFVKKNLPALQKIIEGRLVRNGVDLAITNPTFKEFAKRLIIENWNPDADRAMRESLAPAMKRFYTRYFLAQGHTHETANAFSDVALKMGLLYKNISQTNIAEMIDQTGRGISGVAQSDLKNSWLGVVGVNLKRLPISDDAFKRFWLNFITGHELFHRVWAVETTDPVRMKILQEMKDNVSAMTVEDRNSVLTSAFSHIVPLKDILDTTPGGGAEFLNKIIHYSSAEPDEFIATYMGMLAVGAASPRAAELAQDIMFSPKFLSDFATGFYTDLRDVTQGVIQMATAVGAKSTAMASTVEGMHKTFTMLARTREEINAAVKELALQEAMSPKSFQRTVDTADRGEPIYVREVLDLSRMLGAPEASIIDMGKEFLDKAGVKSKMEPYLGKRPNWFEKNMMIPAQLQELYPVLRDITNLVFSFRGEAENSGTRGMAPFMTLDKYGKPKFDKTSALPKVYASEKMTDALSEIALEQNWQKKELSRGEVEGLTKFKELSDADKETVWTVKDQWKQAMNNMADNVQEYQRMSIADAMASVLINKGGLRSKDAISLGMEMTPVMVEAVDPTKAPLLAPKIQQLLGGFDPLVQKGLIDTFQELSQKYTASKAKIDAQRNYYSPETRIGNFYIRYTKDGVRHFVGKEDINEASKYVDALKTDKSVDQGSIQVADKYDKAKDVNTLYTDIINVYSDIEKSAYEMAASGIEDADVAENFRKLYTPGEAVFKEVVARGFGRHFLQRKLVAGREEINMVHGMVAYIEGMSMGMAKSVTKRRAALLLADDMMKQNPQLRSLARDHVITVVDPPAREWSKFKSLMFHYYMGGNLSSLVVERMQPLFTLAPELTRQGAGLAGGYKLTGEAMKALFNISHKGDSGLPKDWEVGAAMEQAQSHQVLDFGVMQELNGLETDATISSMRNLAEDMEGLSPAQLVTKPLYMYGHLMRGIYLNATSYNSRTAFLAGYIFKKKAGASNTEAYDFATRVTRSTMFGGGSAARPIGLFANKGNMTGVVGALYTLRHYGFSMMSTVYRLAKEGFSKDVNLPEADRANAKKALGQMVATQLFMSGAMGLPMVGGVVGILQQMFPNWNLKATIREGLDSVAGDDEKMGRLLSDTALKGVLSAMSPFDVSQRLGLGDMFGLDPNKGLTASAIFGATGSFFERMVTGVQETAEGQPLEAARQFLPNSMGTMLKLFNDDMKMRDKFGNLIYEPDQVEVLGAAIGFRPKRLADYRDEQAMMKVADEASQRQMREFHDQLSEVLMKGQPELVRQALLQRQLVDETYDSRAGLRAVVEAAQRKMYPTSLSSSGAKSAVSAKEQIAGTFDQGARSVPPESQLLQQRKMMERQVGVPGGGQVHPRELKKAEVVDYLQRLNPAMTRQHALILAERLLGGAQANRGRPEIQARF